MNGHDHRLTPVARISHSTKRQMYIEWRKILSSMISWPIDTQADAQSNARLVISPPSLIDDVSRLALIMARPTDVRGIGTRHSCFLCSLNISAQDMTDSNLPHDPISGPK